MPSLRAQLALWLLGPLLAVWAVSAWLTYENAIESANRAHDRTLLGSVLAISERIQVIDDAIVVDLPYSSLEMLESSLQNRVYYRVSRRSEHLTGYSDLGAPPAGMQPSKPFFYDAKYLGEPVRVAALLKPLYEPSIKEPVLIQVAETAELRNSMSWQIVSDSAIKELLLILLAAALMWWAVNRGLRPLYVMRDRVVERKRGDLSRIESDTIPAELKPLIDAINEHTAQIARITAAQKQFLADAAHQLKTPLAVLRTQADFAAQQKDVAAAREVLDDMRANAERVSHLVDQLLSLNRAEAQAAVALDDIDLAAFARETAFEWLPVALEKSIDLGFEGDQPVRVRGNKVLLHELIATLIDNAIRFTPKAGHVTVSVSDTHSGPRLLVEDTGPGIPEPERERVFDRFYQIPGRESPGCGLGLAIAREIAALHHATISIGAPPGGKGTAASVVFA
jgi:two-component system, OmpR family, sensor histidine kinase TctE